MAPSKTLEHLLQTGDHSDLTLTCKDHRFQVHKAVVCSQSPVINSFLKHDNIESKTSVVNVNFSLEATKSLVDFFYLEDYVCSVSNPAGSELRRRAAVSQVPIRYPYGPLELILSINNLCLAGKDEAEDSTLMEMVMETLLHHVRVDEIADYYKVQELRHLAQPRIDELLDTSALCQSEDFASGLSTFLDFQHDATLRTRMAKFIARHISGCMQLSGFVELLEEPCNQLFVVEILKALAGGGLVQVERDYYESDYE